MYALQKLCDKYVCSKSLSLWWLQQQQKAKSQEIFWRKWQLCWIVTLVVHCYNKPCLRKYSPMTLGVSHAMLINGVKTAAWQMYSFYGAFFKKQISQIYWLNTKQTYSYIGQKSHWDKNQGVSRTTFLPEALGDNLFPSLIQLLEAACIPWFMAPSPPSQSHSYNIFKSLLHLLPSYKDSCDYIGSSWIIQANIPISP